MDQSEDLEILQVLLVGICGMFTMAIAIIVFFLVYQKRIIKQQKLRNELESKHQKELLKASLQSQEAERKKIAQDLHDDVGALLSTSKLYLNQVVDGLKNDKNAEMGMKSLDLHGQMIHKVRHLAKQLRPVVLENLGLITAINNLATQINESDSINMVFETLDNELSLRKDKQLDIYRILQELLNNTLKHAGAQNINLELLWDDYQLCMIYKDDGKGFNYLQEYEGLGLMNITSRATIHNGKVIYASVTKGVDISIIIPIKSNNYEH